MKLYDRKINSTWWFKLFGKEYTVSIGTPFEHKVAKSLIITTPTKAKELFNLNGGIYTIINNKYLKVEFRLARENGNLMQYAEFHVYLYKYDKLGKGIRWYKIWKLFKVMA